MSEFRAQTEDLIPVIKNYEGFGELVTGSNDPMKVLFTALCMLDAPNVNQYLLDNKLKLRDRITKTDIFPREGMSLPNGEFYSTPAKNEESS